MIGKILGLVTIGDDITEFVIIPVWAHDCLHLHLSLKAVLASWRKPRALHVRPCGGVHDCAIVQTRSAFSTVSTSSSSTASSAT